MKSTPEVKVFWVPEELLRWRPHHHQWRLESMLVSPTSKSLGILLSLIPPQSRSQGGHLTFNLVPSCQRVKGHCHVQPGFTVMQWRL